MPKTSRRYASAPGWVASRAAQLLVRPPGARASAPPTSQSGCSRASTDRSPTRNGATQMPARRPAPRMRSTMSAQRGEPVGQQQPVADLGLVAVVDLDDVDVEPEVADRAQVLLDVVLGDLLEVVVPGAPRGRRRPQAARRPAAAAKPSAHRRSAGRRGRRPVAVAAGRRPRRPALTTTPCRRRPPRAPTGSARRPSGAPKTCTPSPVPGSTASRPSPQNASCGAVALRAGSCRPGARR